MCSPRLLPPPLNQTKILRSIGNPHFSALSSLRVFCALKNFFLATYQIPLPQNKFHRLIKDFVNQHFEVAPK